VPVFEQTQATGVTPMLSPQRAASGAGQALARTWCTFPRTWRSALVRHPALRLAQIAPIGALLWGLDDAASLRGGAAVDGMRHAVTVNAVSLDVGGRFPLVMNNWLAADHLGALAATWYYIVLQGALTGVIGALLIWRRPPTLRLHRNALIAITALGLLVFWCYPVAPPRLLPGYHDIVATTLPAFSSVVEPNGSAVYASLPSLHVAWGMWAAIAGAALIRRPALRVLLWLYPAATIVDILATANHYVLDVLTAPGLLVLGYGLAVAVDRARWRLVSRQPTARWGFAPSSPRAIFGLSGWPSALVVRGPYGWLPAQMIRGPDGWPSPLSAGRGHRALPSRPKQPHGAVLACALPAAAGCEGRDGDSAPPR
jgi:PAP2 superfamily